MANPFSWKDKLVQVEGIIDGVATLPEIRLHSATGSLTKPTRQPESAYHGMKKKHYGLEKSLKQKGREYLLLSVREKQSMTS